MEKDAMDAVDKAKQQLAFGGKKSARTPVFAKGVLPMLAVILVGFLAMAVAMYYDNWRAEQARNAQRPPVPLIYHAFFPEDPVVGPILASARPGPDAPIDHPKDVIMTPIGYGGDTPLSQALCKASHDGYLTQIGIYDDQGDGNPESLVVVYTAPVGSTPEPGQCVSNLVFMVDPAWFI